MTDETYSSGEEIGFPRDAARPRHIIDYRLHAMQRRMLQQTGTVQMHTINFFAGILFSSRTIAKVLRSAGVVAVLGMSTTAVWAEAGPFSGFDGSWAGTGIVSLADGTSEQIRCRATYRIQGGVHLKQNLRCASDSYKFELSSDVTSQGNEVTGSWNEASRRIFGNLQGRVAGGQIDVFVEAAGFAANLTLATRDNKQSVSITSKGEIRGVTINMVRG